MMAPANTRRIGVAAADRHADALAARVDFAVQQRRKYGECVGM
jgi:hypothetical protein